MGCWNKTCGITNLPIFHGEEVVVFLLVQSPIKVEARSCYSSGHWNVIPLPIYGKYNDYGWVEEDSGQEWKLDIIRHIFRSNIKRIIPREENGYIRYPEVKDDPFESFEILGESIHGSLFGIEDQVFNNREPVKPIGLIADFFVHRKTFEELNTEFEYWDGVTFTVQDIQKNVELFIEWKKQDEIDEPVNDSDSEQDIEVKRILKSIRKFSYSGMMLNLQSFSATLDPKPENSWRFPGANVINLWFGNNTGSSDGWITTGFTRDCMMAEISIPIKEMIDGALIGETMLGLRKQFFPQGGEGSQDGIEKLHHRFIQSYQNRIKEYDSLYGEDEE